MNAIFNLLNPTNTMTLSRSLAHAIGVCETIVYTALLSKWYYYTKNEMLDKDGWFYSTVPDLEESTALSEYQQKRCITSLIKLGLIQSKNKGLPAKRSFCIVEDIDLIQGYIEAGEQRMNDIKPDAAKSYEKKKQPENGLTISSEETAEQAPEKLQSLLTRNCGASSSETSEQLIYKSKDNNLNIINHPSSKPAKRTNEDFRSKQEVYKEIIEENIELDVLLEQYPDRQEQINEIAELIVDTICLDVPTLRINGGNISKDVVKSRFLKLTSTHIEYVLEAMNNNPNPIVNMRSYLLTALYNAPLTIENYYTAEVNHDLNFKKTEGG